MPYSGGLFEQTNKFEKLENIKHAAQDPDLWDKPNAREITIEYNQLKEEIDSFKTLTNQFESIKDLLNEELDNQMIEMIFEDTKNLQAKTDQVYMNMLFSEEEDKSDCFITVHAGSGGQEAEDWARMLWEMYLKYARNYYKISILDENYTDDGNIKSATMKVSCGDRKFPYGWFKSETGVHRLVRISPYDKKKQRHTSFSSVLVTPAVADNINIEIDEKDLKIDTYRASGAGGQHVNKTESAIRITHMPSGIVVQCQNDRSQHRNKDEAMKMLRAKLFEKHKREQKEAQTAKEGEKKEISWGSQIRSYVQQPYQMVKDNRTGFEIANFGKVIFDAEVEGFLVAFLKMQAV